MIPTKVTILNREFESIDSVCQTYGINHQKYNKMARKEGLDLEGKQQLIIDEAERRQAVLNMRQDFALGILSGRKMPA